MVQESPAKPAILTRTVPGYVGYERPEDRKASDESFRRYLEASLKDTQARLLAYSSQLREKNLTTVANALGKMGKSLASVLHDLQNPIYSDSDFFSLPKAEPDVLEKTYRYDLAVQQQVKQLAEELQGLSEMNAASEESDWAESMARLGDLIDGLNQNLAEREFLLAGGEELA